MTNPMIDEIYKRLCEMDPEDVAMSPKGPHGVLVEIANKEANAHPIWYERFRLWTKVRKWWRGERR